MSKPTLFPACGKEAGKDRPFVVVFVGHEDDLPRRTPLSPVGPVSTTRDSSSEVACDRGLALLGIACEELEPTRWDFELPQPLHYFGLVVFGPHNRVAFESFPLLR